ncbi:histidine phosphatase family protein [Candidatus Poribacteria bacterium]|nr:histidine phosphatase family protein [Candidatus Poribacteria bacterium]
MNRVYLIRHGDVTKNNIPRYFGISDVELNNDGLKQLDSILNFIRNKQIKCVYSSNLKRTIHMAQAAASALKIEHKIIPEFNEINFGKWEGLSFAEIKNKYSEEFESWMEKKLNFSFPAGESLDEVRARVLPKYKEIIFNNSEPEILMILHKSVIKIILCDALKSPDSYWFINQDYAAMNIIDYFPDSHMISLINETNYLFYKCI